jgi:hypothetical protein
VLFYSILSTFSYGDPSCVTEESIADRCYTVGSDMVIQDSIVECGAVQ